MILEEELNWKDFKTKADATFVTSQKSRNPPLLFNGKEYFSRIELGKCNEKTSMTRMYEVEHDCHNIEISSKQLCLCKGSFISYLDLAYL